MSHFTAVNKRVCMCMCMCTSSAVKAKQTERDVGERGRREAAQYLGLDAQEGLVLALALFARLQHMAQGQHTRHREEHRDGLEEGLVERVVVVVSVALELKLHLNTERGLKNIVSGRKKKTEKEN